MVDLDGTEFTSGAASTVIGTHNSLLAAGVKPTVVGHYAVGETAYPHVFVPFNLDSNGTFTGKFLYGDSTVVITVTDADEVTITVTA